MRARRAQQGSCTRLVMHAPWATGPLGCTRSGPERGSRTAEEGARMGRVGSPGWWAEPQEAGGRRQPSPPWTQEITQVCEAGSATDQEGNSPDPVRSWGKRVSCL